jgi:hypothetical protein
MLLSTAELNFAPVDDAANNGAMDAYRVRWGVAWYDGLGTRLAIDPTSDDDGPIPQTYFSRVGGELQVRVIGQIADTAFSGGVFVAAGDVNSDGFADIVVGSSVAPPQRWLVDSGTNVAPPTRWIVSAGTNIAPPNGSAAVGQWYGIPLYEDAFGAGHVKVVDATRLNQVLPNAQLANAAPQAGQALFDPLIAQAVRDAFAGGVTVAAGDFNGDGHAEIVVGTNSFSGSVVKIVDGTRVGIGPGAVNADIACGKVDPESREIQPERGVTELQYLVAGGWITYRRSLDADGDGFAEIVKYNVDWDRNADGSANYDLGWIDFDLDGRYETFWTDRNNDSRATDGEFLPAVQLVGVDMSMLVPVDPTDPSRCGLQLFAALGPCVANNSILGGGDAWA